MVKGKKKSKKKHPSYIYRGEKLVEIKYETDEQFFKRQSKKYKKKKPSFTERYLKKELGDLW